MKKTVIWLFVVLELVAVYGLYITENIDSTDVYEEKEDNLSTNSLNTKSPTPKRLTLRKIYNDIIENPHENKQDNPPAGPAHPIIYTKTGTENPATPDEKKENDSNEVSKVKRSILDSIKDVFKKVAEFPKKVVKTVLRKGRSIEFQGKSYGMSLTGDRGTVWNNIDSTDVYEEKEDNLSTNSLNTKSPTPKRLTLRKIYNDIIENPHENKQDNPPAGPAHPIIYTKTGTENPATPDEKKENDSDEVSKVKRSILDSIKDVFKKVAEFPKKVVKTVLRKGRSIELQGKSYGMSLTGDRGTVWNNLNDFNTSHYVGNTNNGTKDIKNVKRAELTEPIKNEDNDVQADKVKPEFLEDSILKEPRVEKPLGNKPNVEESKALKANNEKPKTVKRNAEEVKTVKVNVKERKSIKPNVQLPNAVEPNAEEPKVVKSNEDVPKMSGKTYGMTLTGEHGTVWNDLNGNRVSYSVGESIENRKYEELQKKASRDDKVIDDLIENFKGDLKETASEEKSRSKEPITKESSVEKSNQDEARAEKLEETIVKVPTTHKPNIDQPDIDETNIREPTVEKPNSEKYNTSSNDESYIATPNIEKSNTEESKKSEKTYGMSLNGDHGIVWNDLNGDRVSYHVGETTDSKEVDTSEHTTIKQDDNRQNGDKKDKPTNQDEENTSEPTKTKPDLDELIQDALMPNDVGENGKLKPDIPSEIGNALNKVDSILHEFTEETEKTNNNSKILVHEIVGIIKEVFANETAKLESKSNSSCDSNTNNDAKVENDKKEENGKDDEEQDNDNISELPEDIQKLMESDQFWKWFNDWSTAYIDLLMNRVDAHIKEEVTKQIEDYFATHTQEDRLNEMNTNDSTEKNETLDPNYDENKENLDEDDSLSKKRKEKDSEDNANKEAPVKIVANNLYGNSVGNGNVTNIFIFDISKISEIPNIAPLNNITNDMFGSGNDEKNPTENELEINKESEGGNSKTPDDQTNIIEDQNIKEVTAEKSTQKPAISEESNSKQPIENPEETIDSTISPVEIDSRDKDNKSDILEGNKNKVPEKSTEPSNLLEENKVNDVNVITENETLKLPTENPKGELDSTTKPTENKDLKDKENGSDNIEGNNNKQKPDKPNGLSENTIKETTTETETSKPDIEETAETIKENIQSTTKPDEDDNLNKSGNEDSKIEEDKEQRPSEPSEDNEMKEMITEKVISKPNVEEKKPQKTTENPVETTTENDDLKENDGKDTISEPSPDSSGDNNKDNEDSDENDNESNKIEEDKEQNLSESKEATTAKVTSKPKKTTENPEEIAESTTKSTENEDVKEKDYTKSNESEDTASDKSKVEPSPDSEENKDNKTPKSRNKTSVKGNKGTGDITDDIPQVKKNRKTHVTAEVKLRNSEKDIPDTRIKNNLVDS